MRVVLTCLLALSPLWLGASRARAQSFALDPASSSLATIPATSADILLPAVPPGTLPPPLAPPAVGLSYGDIGLLAGDVIDAFSFLADTSGTLYITVSRASAGTANPQTPNVASEVGGVPPGGQPEAASDIFGLFDPACPSAGQTQVLDGDGFSLAPLTCYTGLGLGLEEQLSLPGPPLNDAIRDFDWALPGRGRLYCFYFSLKAGSPSLTPGTNPLLPSGASPADLLLSCPDGPVRLGVAIPGSALGLVSSPAGCAPPVCDDLDALAFATGPLFSLAPGSPSPFGPGDVIGAALHAPPALVYSAAAIGLLPGDDVTGLAQAANPCPVSPAADADGDGVGACDNCAGFNPGQEDSDADGVGDACDTCTDWDGDGFGNAGFPASLCAPDLCPTTPGANLDGDGDGAADECDSCPDDPPHLDGDFDGIDDPCDPCPRVAAAPGVLTARKVALLYGGDGPGGMPENDRPRIIRAVFASGVDFDPAAADDVQVRIRDGAIAGDTLFSADLGNGTGLWRRPNASRKRWVYSDADPAAPPGSPGVRRATLVEKPPGSGSYTFKMVGRSATVAQAPAGSLTVTLEIAPAAGGVCVADTLGTCSGVPLIRDVCLNP